MKKAEILEKIAKRLRIFSLMMTTEAGSGHPTTCLSMAELMSCLFFHEMEYNIENADDLANDEFVLSKGHAAPILWATYAEAGIISHKSLMNLRKLRSNLEGHPTPRMKWVKAATGSLGQGLSVGVGIALAQKLHKSPARTFVLMGDGECAEGAVWESANMARILNLDNLRAVVDVNRLGQSEQTMHGHDLRAYAQKFCAFGWKTFSVDGHDIEEILEALEKSRKIPLPVAILAKTVKGKGVSFVEDRNGWHGKPLKPEELEKALRELGPLPEIEAKKYVRKPKSSYESRLRKRFNFQKNIYREKAATRLAYGMALANLGKINPAVIALDGDVKNSTYAEKFFEALPERSFQSYIAEQNMIGMAMGLSAKGYIPFVATFSAFLSRGHDQIRMAAYSFSNIKFIGSHAGVSIGEDGPSQMGLEDLAIFRPIPGCVVFYPCDAYSTEGCLQAMAEYKGLAYLRTTRPATPLIYSPEEKFSIGGFKVLRRSEIDMATVVAAGITVHEALKAHEELKRENIAIRVIDAYCVQPLDGEKLWKEVEETRGNVVVAEDHFPAGGLGEAVVSALGGKARFIHLCIRELPRSGKPEELMDKYGISARHIKNAIKSMLRDAPLVTTPYNQQV